MSTWLYQIDATKWSPETFRSEIWEGRTWRWERRRMKPAKGKPEIGDTIVFYYCQSNFARNAFKDWGFYGWAVLDQYDARERGHECIYFTPTSPTNWLKMDPWRDDESNSEVQGLVNKIRGNMSQGTLFLITMPVHIQKIRDGIREHLSRA